MNNFKLWLENFDSISSIRDWAGAYDYWLEDPEGRLPDLIKWVQGQYHKLRVELASIENTLSPYQRRILAEYLKKLDERITSPLIIQTIFSNTVKGHPDSSLNYEAADLDTILGDVDLDQQSHRLVRNFISSLEDFFHAISDHGKQQPGYKSSFVPWDK